MRRTVSELPGRRAAGILNVEDARRRARRALPRTVFDYVDGGAEDERTLRANRQAFSQLALRPRVAVDCPEPRTSTTVLGAEVSLPVLLAPCGLMGTVHPDAEPATARVAARLGTIAAFSTYTSTTLEHIAGAANGPKWFQLYFLGGRAGAESLVDRAARAGYGALVVTVDTNVPGNRERDLRNRVRYPLRVRWREAITFGPQVVLRPAWLARFARAGFPLEVANAEPAGPDPLRDDTAARTIFDTPPTWADLAWIRERWEGSLVVKGVLSSEDAERAADAGADAVVVSNHGGRQLDGAPATLAALPAVVDAVGDRVEVLLDGGVRRGSDVATALALGARAVLVGRPYLWGLAAGGEAGVERVLEVLRTELVRTLQLCGCASVSELDRSWLWPTAAHEVVWR